MWIKISCDPIVGIISISHMYDLVVAINGSVILIKGSDVELEMMRTK